MKKPIEWIVTIESRNEENFTKLLKWLSKQDVYEYTVLPNYMKETYNVRRIEISSAWTNNLYYLTKWIDKNISDEI